MLKLLCLAWIIGIACIGIDHQALDHLQLWYPCAILSSIVLLYFVLWFRQRLTGRLLMRLLLMWSAGICMLLCGMLYADAKLEQALGKQVSSSQQIDALIYIKQLSHGTREQPRQVAELILREPRAKLSILIYPTWQSAASDTATAQLDLQLGQYYLASLQLKPPQDLANPGGFDAQAWFLQQRIQGTANLLYAQALSAQQVLDLGFSDHLHRQDQWVAKLLLAIEQLRGHYRQTLLADGDDDKSRGLLLALLSGDQSALDSDTSWLYQSLGISHLVAISGPHVLFLAAVMLFLVTQLLQLLMRHGYWVKLYLAIPKQYLYLPLFILCISFYVVFTGFEIPALRTWLMACIFTLALCLKLPISKFSVLLLAASMVLLVDCFSILSAAFWLSFGAASILLWVYQSLLEDKTQTSYKPLVQSLVLLWQSQWRIFLGLLPIVLWQFKAVALLAPLTNMVAIPFLSLVIIPLNLISACLWLLIPSFAKWLWGINSYLLQLFHMLLKQLQPLAELLYVNSFLTWNNWLCLSIAIAILCAPRGLIVRFWSVFFVLPVLFGLQQRPHLAIDVLDVGQGQALTVQTQHHQLLYDTARGSWHKQGRTVADREIVPFLRSKGISKLDLLMLSHLDDDHRGGLETISKNFGIGLISANHSDEGIQALPITFRPCVRGQSWQWDQVSFDVLHPEAGDDLYDENESSCILLIKTKMQQSEFKILIMGDAGWQSEYQLLRRYPQLEADILVVGHHGSRHSSAYDFLAQINPKLALISVGADNRYAHPSPELLARLAALNIPVLTTIEAGAIHIELKDSAQIWQWHAERKRRKWLRP